MITKPFVQIIASIVLILVACMVHYQSYRQQRVDDTVLYQTLFVVGVGFVGLYYSIYGWKRVDQALLVFAFVYGATASHLYEHTQNPEMEWNQFSSLLMIIGWVALGFILHVDPTERVYILLAILVMLYAWLYLSAQFRARGVSDHPSYVLMVLSWVFIAYRLTKIDY